MRRQSLWLVFSVLAGLFVAAPGRADDWPEWLGPNRDGVWRETGLLDKFPKGGPKVMWRKPIGGGYSGPSVAAGRLYVMDRQPTLGPDGKPQPSTRAGLPGTERTLCLDAADGKLLWKDEYPCLYTFSYRSGPRTTPLVRDGRVYTLGAMGDLRCLNAQTGKPYWTKELTKEYKTGVPVWGWAAHPLLDGDLLYCLVGGPKTAVVAFHKETGKEAWRALTTKEVAYSPPMIYEAGGKRQLIVWLSDSINSLDPATGSIYWTMKYPVQGELTQASVNIATSRRMGELVFFTNVFHGPLMLKLAPDKAAASVLWQDKTTDPNKPLGLRSLIPTPVLKADHIYGISFNGELMCCRADNGDQVWETLALMGGKKTDCGTAFLVPQGDRFFLFGDQGDLILAHLSPKGYKELDRAHILNPCPNPRGRDVVWSHPAFAQRCVFARNDKEIICVSLAAKQPS
jgi:outer membrane protein assembly factor BamB